MNRTGLVIALLAAFFAGVSAGLVGGVIMAQRLGPRPPFEMRERPERHDRPGHGGPGGMMLQRLERELDLDADQKQRIERILEQARASHDVTRDSTIAAIERVLTTEQRERWAGIRRQMEKRFRPPRGDALAPPEEPGRP